MFTAIRTAYFLLLLLLCSHVNSVTVDLRDPEFCQGVLTTTQGGVITDIDLRIQARNIKYINRTEGETSIMQIEAEEDLLLEFGEYVFVGSRLEYDFVNKSGVIYNGRSCVPPWFFGGESIRLCPDGSYIIVDGFATTSESIEPEWQILMREGTISPDHFLKAKNVQLRLFRYPILWVPKFSANLNALFDSPLSYSLKWGGKRGTRVGIIYELISHENLQMYARLDYRFKRGPGGGFETHYRSLDRKHTYDSINYIAHDNSVTNESERIRYRFQGLYHGLFDQDRITVDFSYDKLSDSLMATDYADNGLELETALKTQLLARRQTHNWIANFMANVRINSFQTINQQLPTLALSWRPMLLGRSGVIFDNYLKMSYMNFVYAKSVPHAQDFSSSRLEFSPHFYRPYKAGIFTFTPDVGTVSIYYGSNQSGDPRWLNMGLFSFTGETQLYRHYWDFKHVIEPYATYSYYTTPTVSPDHHNIFDIDDGWYRLNMLEYGVSQTLYRNDYFARLLSADIYAYTFFNTPTVKVPTPTVYTDVTYQPTATSKYVLNFGWDFRENELARLNIRKEWTFSTDLALAIEYRHRNRFDWRKADHTNFILDSFRSVQRLLKSSVSDRRDTFLVHLFYRIHHSVALEYQSRHGWNRILQPSYTEFLIGLHISLRSAWNLKLIYEHKEKDTRFSISMFMDFNRPNREKLDCIVPLLDF